MANYKPFGKKGYTWALVLCAAALALTGLIYQKAEKTEPVQTPPLLVEDGVEQMQTVEVIATQPAPTASAPTTAPTTQPTQPVRRKLKTASPLAGTEIAQYSVDCLSYNPTTRDWRVHDGIDLAAEEGTDVLAAAEGVVTFAGEDELLGYTVTLRHEGGYTTQYSSLAESLSVSVGEEVALGQKLGEVGTTALLESAVGSHLHFAVTSQGSTMDPGAFLSIGEE